MKPSNARVDNFETWVACAALAFMVAACADSTEPRGPVASSSQPSMWVGEVADSDVKVAIAEQEGTATVFFCGGETSYDTSTRWFNEALLLKEPFSFTEDGWRVDGAVSDGAASGVIQPENGDESAWSAEQVQSDTIAGLYQGVAPCGRLGLIVTQATADDEPSGQGACTRIEDEVLIVEQVNPVRLHRDAEGGIPVTVGESGEQFTVLPVAVVAL